MTAWISSESVGRTMEEIAQTREIQIAGLESYLRKLEYEKSNTDPQLCPLSTILLRHAIMTVKEAIDTQKKLIREQILHIDEDQLVNKEGMRRLSLGTLENSQAPTLSTSNDHSHLKVRFHRRKPRRCWSKDLHFRFIEALQSLGGSKVATPKQIRDFMKVDGLTSDEVKSHLQKYRLHIRKLPTNASGLGHKQCHDDDFSPYSPDSPLQLCRPSLVGNQEDEYDQNLDRSK